MLRLLAVGKLDQVLVLSVDHTGLYLEVFSREEYDRAFDDDDREPIEAFQVSSHPNEMLQTGSTLIDSPVIGDARFFETPDRLWAGILSTIAPDPGSGDRAWLHLQIDYLSEDDERLALHIRVPPMDWMRLSRYITDYWIS